MFLFLIGLIFSVLASQVSLPNQKSPETIEQVQIQPSPTEAPTPTLTPIPTASVKKIFTPTPTKATKAPLTVYIDLPDKNVTSESKTFTIKNLSTGEEMAKQGEGYIYFYDLKPGEYRITVKSIADHRTAHAICDGDCGPGSYNWRGDDWGENAGVIVEEGKTKGVKFYWFPNESVPNCKGGIDKPYCI